MKSRVQAAALILAISGALPGCGTTPAATACQKETRADTWVPDLAKAGQGGRLSARLVSVEPSPPQNGDNAWALRILDDKGAGVDGATLTVTPFMPDHGHGTPKKVVVAPGPVGGGPGVYLLTVVNLFMTGLWAVTIDARTAAGVTDAMVYSFCIDG